MTRVRGNRERIERKTVVTDSEFNDLTEKARQVFKTEYFKLRCLALLSILRLCGKRRSEIAKLEVDSLKTENGFLSITFTLSKKRKDTILNKQATKSIPLSDPLTSHIQAYLEYLNKLEPKPKFYFPSGHSIFGQSYIIDRDRHLSPRQLFNLVRSLSENVWLHLFRETVASDIIKSDPTIIGAFKIQRRLDLEDYRTGFNYLKRFASDVIEREQKQNAES